MDPEEQAAWEAKINSMSQEEMARVWRFASPGEYPFFDSKSPLWPVFQARWDEVGGMTPEVSKKIGWEE